MSGICLKPSPDTDIRTLNPENVAFNLLPGAYRVPGNIPAPIPRAWEPETGKKKDFCLFQVLSNMQHVPSDPARLGLEFLSNLLNHIGPTVSKWSNLNVPGH